MSNNFRNAAQLAATKTIKASYPIMSKFENCDELVDVLSKRYGSSFIPSVNLDLTPKMVEVICKTGKGVFANQLAGALSGQLGERALFDVSYTFDLDDNIDQILVTGAIEEFDDLTIGIAHTILESMDTSNELILTKDQAEVVKSYGPENFLGMVKASLDAITPEDAETPAHELFDIHLFERTDGTIRIIFG